MRMREYYVNGIGFYTDDISGEALSIFLFRTHKDTLPKINNRPLTRRLTNLSSELAASPEYNEDDILDGVMDCTNSGTYAEAVSEVMSTELGIRISFAGMDENGKEAVFFEARYPWRQQYSKKEKTLSRESLKEMLEPYAKELGRHVEDIQLRFYS